MHSFEQVSSQDATSRGNLNPFSLESRPPPPEDSSQTCHEMIWFQLVVFILFYVSLIIIIICMYCKYRKECKQMEDNGESEEKFRMVKKLMKVYDTKE